MYVGAGCDPDLTLPYLKGLLNVGGVMVAPFREELIRMEVRYVWVAVVQYVSEMPSPLARHGETRYAH